ncbi:MAG: hypothetical protein AB7N70_22610 [Dehalococcoidia bacterium]
MDTPSLKDLKRDISQLSREEYRALRRWLLAHDAGAWDREIDEDVRSEELVRLDGLALRAFADGWTSRLQNAAARLLDAGVRACIQSGTVSTNGIRPRRPRTSVSTA